MSPSTDKIINLESSIKNIQGPCGNSTFVFLSTNNDYDGITSISRINDEQLIIEERYSTVNGCFGMVKTLFEYLFFLYIYFPID